MKTLAEQTLAEIALKDHAYIPILEKYNLDFCCRGKRTLQEACREKDLQESAIVKEMEECTRDTGSRMPFTEMTAEQLISYIIIHHHFYVKNNIPVILSHLDKVLYKHGEKYPYMKQVDTHFRKVADELLQHMKKEEAILFPLIKEMMSGNTTEPQPVTHTQLSGQLNAIIQKMEAEHDDAGQLLFAIRELTSQYTAPETACTTHRVCLDELRAFEEDLHRHVHLENNILFPMALHPAMTSIVQ